uniref:hypothetical protein n=1 Tax=Mesotoga sp. UBA5557 TaxID=1946857 RepID=UPI0025E08DF9
DGILDEEPRTWTRSVGTKNRSSRRTGPRSGTKNEFSSEDGGPLTDNVVLSSVQPSAAKTVITVGFLH